MSAQVISMDGEPIPLIGDACPEVVEALERALAKARAGKMRAVAVAYVSKERWIAWDMGSAGAEETWALVAATRLMMKEHEEQAFGGLHGPKQS